MSRKAIKKYLLNYAEPEIAAATFPGERIFDHCLVIPAFCESPDFLRRLITDWPQLETLLVIVVVNRPDNCDRDTFQSAKKSLDQIRQTLPLVIADNGLSSWRQTKNCKISFLLVDRCSNQPVPHKQGVGLARKIGCDIALKLFEQKQLTTGWISTTDADAHLPADYFARDYPEASAAVYPYRYLEAEPELYLATRIYDCRNRDYRSQLRSCGSPYAFNPTGSLLGLHLPSYAQVRGFPKRAGGEDFYLLNKLQKVSGVAELDGSPVQLECRISDRVPFGTGPAVARLLQTQTPQEEPVFYHPLCYQVFRQGLTALRSTTPSGWLSGPDMPKEFKSALSSLNIQQAQKHLQPLFDRMDKDSAGSSPYHTHLNFWFDAFQSLKTIHYLRDHFFGSISYRQWLEAR